MKFTAKSTSWQKVNADVVVLFATEENWQKQLAEAEKLLVGTLVRHLTAEDFKAKEGQIVQVPTFGKLAAPALTVAGVGKESEVTVHTLRKVTAQLAKRVRSTQKKTVALALSSPVFQTIDSYTVAKAVVEGIRLGLYQFVKYRSEDKKQPRGVKEVLLLVNAGRLQNTVNGIAEGDLYAAATTFARNLINESPTITTPTYLASVAKNLASPGKVSVDILEEKDVRKLGMNAYLAVSRGSEEPPKFIRLMYKGGKKKVVLVGKAITFDTGGLSLKDAKNMETMKLDMAGAAAVLGIFSALPKLKPTATVIGLIAACENMPGPRASKPGDIVTAANGKSIEILNTDAEGRLTLADALSYGSREKPEYLIDIATLTGACMVALGEEIAGLFVNNDTLKSKLLRSADEEGEKLWQLPLEKEYKETVKSDIADLRNISKTRYGGAITAALFLEEFVDGIAWAHMDIAGPAYEEKETPVVPKGGAGFSVRMLLNFIKNL